jgi:hypothetical protein
MKLSVTLLLAAALSGAASMGAATGTAVAADNQITILYDVFGNDRTMKKDWGYSALVEVAGKRICSTLAMIAMFSPQVPPKHQRYLRTCWLFFDQRTLV